MRMIKELSSDDVRNVIDCDYKTGECIWRKRAPDMFKDGRGWYTSERNCNSWNNRFAGKPVGHIDLRTGYRHVSFKGKKYLLHRIIFLHEHGRWPENHIDHKDGTLCGDVKLREATFAQNLWNRGRLKNNQSGIKNVSKCRHANGWYAEVSANRIRRRKYFTSLDEAIAFVKSARDEMHGEFANHGDEVREVK